MFCSNCGAQNADFAKFCMNCGAPLGSAQPVPSPSSPTQPSIPQVPVAERKNSFVATILNLFFGIGYLYLGYKKVLGLSTILFVVVALIIEILVGVFTFGFLSLVLAIVLAYDGYLKAEGQKGYVSTEPVLIYQG